VWQDVPVYAGADRPPPQGRYAVWILDGELYVELSEVGCGASSARIPLVLETRTATT
jgi:hypothetical protein